MYSVKDMPISGAIIGDGFEMKLNNIGYIELNTESPIDPTDPSYSTQSIKEWKKSFEATIEFSSPLEFLDEVCNPQLSPCKVEGVIGRIQKRRHKKFRINKKWAKRYGYYNVKLKGKFNPDVSVSWSDKEYPKVEATITDIGVYTE